MQRVRSAQPQQLYLNTEGLSRSQALKMPNNSTLPSYQLQIECDEDSSHNEHSLAPQFPAGYIHIELGKEKLLKVANQKQQQQLRNRRKRSFNQNPNSMQVRQVTNGNGNQPVEPSDAPRVKSEQVSRGSKFDQKINILNERAATIVIPSMFAELQEEDVNQMPIIQPGIKINPPNKFEQYKRKREQEAAHRLKHPKKYQKHDKKDKMQKKNIIVLPLTKTVQDVDGKTKNLPIRPQDKFHDSSSNIVFSEQHEARTSLQGISEKIAVIKTPPPSGNTYEYTFNREKVFFTNFMNPQYTLSSKSGEFVVNAKKQFGYINSFYTISVQHKNFQKQGLPYVGYLQGNFTGSEFNLYQRNGTTHQIVATIDYNSEISCAAKCRKLEIYMKHPFANIQSKQGSTLKELYEEEENALSRSIIKLVNKEPKWSEQMDCYILNFHGKSKYGSTKNVILVEEGRPNDELLLFCKTDLHQFHMEVKNPITPFVAMGLVLSSFDFKLCCQ